VTSAFADLGALLGQYGYLAVAVLVLVEDFGVPAPGETVLILASIAAHDGRLNILAVAGIAFAAAVVGDNIGFAIGRFGGRPLLHRYGRYVLLTPHRLERAERFMVRHGGKVVVIARFVEGLRQANGLLAGATGMPWRRFLPYNAIGAAAWVGVWATLGYLAGGHLPEIEHLVTRYELYLLGAAVLAVAGFVGWRVLRARRRRRALPVPDSDPR
jgi:membrane protein DedA with SNARE-associated domain